MQLSKIIQTLSPCSPSDLENCGKISQSIDMYAVVCRTFHVKYLACCCFCFVFKDFKKYFVYSLNVFGFDLLQYI